MGDKLRAEINNDVQRFLESGGTITEYPPQEPPKKNTVEVYNPVSLRQLAEEAQAAEVQRDIMRIRQLFLAGKL